MSKILNNKGIETAVYRENQEIYNDSIFQLLCCGLSQKFDIIFDFGKEKNNKILNDTNEYKKLCEELKNILSKKLNINKNNIIFSLPQKGSVKISVAFITPGIYEESQLKSALSDVKEAIEVHKTVLMEGCKLTRNIFDQTGNNKDPGWGIGEKRGGYDYIPPLGWYGYGLKVRKKYDNGNDDWLSYSHPSNEYAIAYFPIKNYYESTKEMLDIIKNLGEGGIMKDNLDQFHDIFENEIDINKKKGEKNKNSKDDNICKKGIYLYQDIKIAENQASIIEIDEARYKVLIMCRVKPDAIRIPKNFDKIWILNPNSEEIRQYRILIKIEKSKIIADNTLITYSKPMELFKKIISEKDICFYTKQKDKIDSIMNDKKCTKEEAIVNIYTSYQYRIFNNYLIKNTYEKYCEYKEEELKSYIWCLHSILTDYYPHEKYKKLKTVEDGKTLYRKTKIPFDENIYGVGKQFYFAGFTSASYEDKLNIFGQHKMIITIRNNKIKNYCYYVEDVSNCPSEKEVLITAYSNFIIKKITKNENGYFEIEIDCIGYVHNDEKAEKWPIENGKTCVIYHEKNN